MAHDVFISYSSKDKTSADALTAAMEQRRIRCWVAPRDVVPGMPFSGQIKRAIDDCRIMILIFSSNSNGSSEVLREVQLAARCGCHIVSFRIEEVSVCDDLDYYLAIADFDKAIELNPDCARAYSYRGVAHNNKGEIEKAKDDYAMALKIDPSDVTAIVNSSLLGGDHG